MRPYSQLTSASYLMSPVQITICHIGSLLVPITGLSWGSLLWMGLLYIVRGMATTGVYHRLLTHKSYRAPRPVLWIGSLLAASAGQLGPSCWKAHHLAHHQYTDQAFDPHSPHVPTQGFRGVYWAHVGWLLSPNLWPAKLPADVENDRVLRVIDRLHFVPVIAVGLLSYLIGGLEYLGAFFLSTTLLFHIVQTVNSLAHLFGDQPFATNDQSRNNGLVASIALGEGWHNLHHAFQASSRHGITIRDGKVVYLPDPTFWFLKLLERLGLASNLRVPTESELLARAKSTTPPPSPRPAMAKSGQS